MKTILLIIAAIVLIGVALAAARSQLPACVVICAVACNLIAAAVMEIFNKR